MSWAEIKLGEVTTIRTGKLDANASSEDGQYPFFTCATKPLRISSYSYDCECVLVAGNGDLNVKHYQGKFDAYQRTYIIEALDKEDSNLHLRYVYRFLETYLERLREQSIGGIIKYIKLGNLTNAKIPLPPLEEQKRIAKILDAADALRAKRRESIAQLDALLTSTFLDLFGDPARNTKGLPTVKLGDIGHWKSGGTPSRSRPNYFFGDIPWFSSGDLEGLFLANSTEQITAQAIAETSAKVVRKGSLLLGMYDTAALKAGISMIEGSCNQAVAFALIDETVVNTLYVYFAITIGREHFRRLQRGVRQKNLNLSMVREIEIPLPPKSAQAKFIDLVGSAMKQKKLLQNHQVQVSELFSSIQSQAFSGEL